MKKYLNRKVLFAYFVLALLFFKHMFKKIFHIKSNGIEIFKENYHSEFLIELKDEQYEELPLFQSCINCSLCDVYCDVLGNFQREGMPNLSTFILSNSRSMEEFRFSYKEIDIFSECTDCHSCEGICPNEYPIFDLMNFMAQQNESLEAFFEEREN